MTITPTPLGSIVALITSLTLTLIGGVLLGAGVRIPEEAANIVALTGPQLAAAIVALVLMVQERQRARMLANEPPETDVPYDEEDRVTAPRETTGGA